MALKLRPSGLGSGIDKDRPDYAVYSGEWEIGRIYQTRGGPDSLRWFWSLDRQRSDDALCWPPPSCLGRIVAPSAGLAQCHCSQGRECKMAQEA